MKAHPVSTAIIVADEILRIAKRQGKSLTPMQLVKLTYIAHGWALAILGRGLFSYRIEAWKYGPVIPSLYYETKRFGRSVIPADLIDEDIQSVLPKEIVDFLEDVVNKYGHLSGIALSSLTHREGSPWHQVYKKGVMNIRIDDDRIQNYYKEKLRKV